MNDSQCFQTLQAHYFLLDTSFNTIFAACTTDDERNELRTDYTNARDNFWEARSRAFHDDDPVVKNMLAELDDDRQQIEQSIQDLQNIVSLLQVITSAVRLGSSLVMMGSVA